MRTFYGLDAVEAAAESIYICPQEILAGYPCKKREVIHIIHKVIRFWAEQAVFYVNNRCDSI